jgi:hypothetical protein
MAAPAAGYVDALRGKVAEEKAMALRLKKRGNVEWYVASGQ